MSENPALSFRSKQKVQFLVLERFVSTLELLQKFQISLLEIRICSFSFFGVYFIFFPSTLGGDPQNSPVHTYSFVFTSRSRAVLIFLIENAVVDLFFMYIPLC